MKVLLFLTLTTIIICLPAFGESPTPITGDLNIPENYEEKQKIVKEREQVIPLSASRATSPGAFSGKILEYHLATVLENNKFNPLKSVKSLENVVNKNTEVDSKHFKLKSKLDMNRLRAEMDIETFINTKVWTEDSFKTLRAQMKLYEMNQGFLSIENKTNQEDTRTYLNLNKTW